MTKHILTHKLNLNPDNYGNLHTFLLCNPHIQSQEELTTVALLIYATYNTTNQLRSSPTNWSVKQQHATAEQTGTTHNVTHNTNIHDLITQWLREGARQHPKATLTLDNRWNPTRRSTPLPPIRAPY